MALTKVTDSMLATPATPTDTTTIEDDIALLGFKVAVAGTMAKYNLVDQTEDAFIDATGIDASTSTNETRSAANYYSGTTAVPTGGTITTYTDSGTDYTVHTFLTGGTFTRSQTASADYIVVAGGGSGGGAGGGGAGGFLTGTVSISTNQAVVIGTGGVALSANGVGNDGLNSSLGATVATGGGGGGTYSTSVGANAGRAGGSGGGGGWKASAGGAKTASPAQGNDGGTSTGTSTSPYTCAGGGGSAAAGAADSGSNSGSGGVGTVSAINGTSLYWAAGGGGGAQKTGIGGNGGLGGGGGGADLGEGTPGTGGGSALNSGGAGLSGDGGSAGANTGSGGGGMGISVNNSGAGGSGIVIIRYIDGAFGGAADMVLQSNSTTAEATATKGDIVMTYTNGSGTATLNTDLTAEFSANNGTDWTSMTLVAQGSTGTHFIVSAHNVTADTSGTAMKYRIKTLNQGVAKETRIQAVSLGWS